MLVCGSADEIQYVLYKAHLLIPLCQITLTCFVGIAMGHFVKHEVLKQKEVLHMWTCITACNRTVEHTQNYK